MATVLLALLVVVVSAAPFLLALALFAAGWRRARLDAELKHLLGAPGGTVMAVVMTSTEL